MALFSLYGCKKFITLHHGSLDLHHVICSIWQIFSNPKQNSISLHDNDIHDVNSYCIFFYVVELGKTCNPQVGCADQAATCTGSICSCNSSTHYDSNGNEGGGACNPSR